MQHQTYSRLWAYFPETGEVVTIRNGEPVRALWYRSKANVIDPHAVSFKARARSKDEGIDIEDKAENVAFVLLSGKDMPKGLNVKHLNGNKQDNRAVNLYTVQESSTAPPTAYLPDTPRAALLARAVGTTPVKHGALVALTGFYAGTFDIVSGLLHNFKSAQLDKALRGVKPDDFIAKNREALEAYKHDEPAFLAWLEALAARREATAHNPALSDWAAYQKQAEEYRAKEPERLAAIARMEAEQRIL